MRKNPTILILSLVAIAIVTTIEIVLVTRIYRLETEKFDFRYREIMQKGLSYLDKTRDAAGLENVSILMNKQALKALPYYGQTPDTLQFREIVLQNFQKALDQNQDIDRWLKGYLTKMKVESDFKSRFAITYLGLIDENGMTVPIFNVEKDTTWGYPDTLGIRHDQIPVNHYSLIRDNFEIGINYYVDFHNKKAIVLKEIGGSLTIAVLALIAISLIFFLTMRNLLEERRLSQLKTDFINNMTHELKTPLSTISIATRTLENENILDNRDKIRETVSVIRRQNRQLTKQINHLLEISMWERRQFSLERRTMEVEPFISGIAEAFRWECKERPCTLTENYHIVRKTAYLDEVQMTVALHNLLINGVKYNGNHPELILDVHCDDRLKITVTDNGIGIGKEDQKHIFDKFYRVSTGNVHKVKGLGLGLFYVRQIIEAHGGTIEVSSRPGKGSTFTIIIPAHGKSQNTPG
jgi:two-component system phosphate regulon sensor histidine kinase PhoR